MKKDISRIREVTEESLEKLEQLEDISEDISAAMEAVEESEEKLEQIEDSLRESVKSSSAILEETRGLRRELELRRKGQPGWCQKHGHTYLLWKSGVGWRCAKCIEE